VRVWPGSSERVRADHRRRMRRTYGLALDRFRAHISGMAAIVQCNCGAEYRRTEEKFLAPHTGDAVCGAGLESWLESTHVPSYELVERPERPDRKPGRPA
jgi:hypothetical protein